MKRLWYSWMVLGLLVGHLAEASELTEVNLESVAKLAEQLAQKPYAPPHTEVPQVLKDLNYDSYRQIVFDAQKALWREQKDTFHAHFYHMGYLYKDAVRMHETDGRETREIPFTQRWFEYGTLPIPPDLPRSIGYAGFKLLYPVNATGRMDEVSSFLGASYYRMLGAGQRYGASARGLAIDAGEADRKEEFPAFRQWWLARPQAGHKELRMYALLDSVSCAGAYEFRVRPGETTEADVSVIIYLRKPEHTAGAREKPMKTLGLAPLTSMFWFGKNSERKFDDYRPEVHDSDGLLIRSSTGETLWRPLNNAKERRHQIFALPGVKGFGLLQRERDFQSYQDIFNYYHLVPSVWVEPHGDWGAGEVHLIELNTDNEAMDNIVAFWNPQKRPAPLQAFRFGYKLKWTRETDQKLSQNIVVNTRIGAAKNNQRWREISIDFGGEGLKDIPEQDAPKAVVSCSDNATVRDSQVFKNPVTHTWRAVLKLEPKEGNTAPVDLRCTLKHQDKVVSETWTYHWSPP